MSGHKVCSSFAHYVSFARILPTSSAPERSALSSASSLVNGISTNFEICGLVPEYFAFLAVFIGIDNPTTSARTRELLDWEPTHPGLIADLDAGHYFAPQAP